MILLLAPTAGGRKRRVWQYTKETVRLEFCNALRFRVGSALSVARGDRLLRRLLGHRDHPDRRHDQRPEPVHPKVWAMESLRILKENMGVTSLVHRDFQNEVASFGDLVHTRWPQEMNVYRRSDTTDVTPQAVWPATCRFRWTSGSMRASRSPKAR